MPRMFRTAAHAIAALAAATTFGAAHATPYSESYNQLFGPGYAVPFPGCCSWAQDTIGWYWTPGQSFQLTTIETILVNLLNGINDDFPLTVTLFTDRPAVGGTALASATFNPGQFYAPDPGWHGQAFATPVSVSAGTAYFVGFSGWDLSQTADARGGINWVLQPDFPDGLPPGVQFLSQAFIGNSFETGIGTASTVTAAPVIKFVGDVGVVPEPPAHVLMGLGVAAFALARRR